VFCGVRDARVRFPLLEMRKQISLVNSQHAYTGCHKFLRLLFVKSGMLWRFGCISERQEEIVRSAKLIFRDPIILAITVLMGKAIEICHHLRSSLVSSCPQFRRFIFQLSFFIKIPPTFAF